MLQFVSEAFMDSFNYPYVLRAMLVFGVLSDNCRMWWFSCTFCICRLLSSSTYFCLSMLQFFSEVFMDSCNYHYVLRAMPVFGVLSVNWEMWCFSCNFCFNVLYLLRLPSACLCLSSLVKPSSIHAIILTCFVLCQSLESFLSTGGCGFCYVYLVFAFFYLHLFLTSACLGFRSSAKSSWTRAITPTWFVLCRSLGSFLSIGGLVVAVCLLYCCLLSSSSTYCHQLPSYTVLAYLILQSLFHVATCVDHYALASQLVI